MTNKVDISEITDSPGSVVPAINDRLRQIEDIFNEQILFRNTLDVLGDNEMEQDLDINDNDVLNINTLQARVVRTDSIVNSGDAFDPTIDRTIEGVYTFEGGIKVPQGVTVELYDGDAETDTAGNTRIVSNSGFYIQRCTSPGFWRTVMQITPANALVMYDTRGRLAAVIDDAGTLVNDSNTVITKEKGDEVYAKHYPTEAQAAADTSGRIVFADEGT